MKAQQFEISCPICNQPIEDDMKTHLFEHSKTDLISELLAYLEAEDQDSETED